MSETPETDALVVLPSGYDDGTRYAHELVALARKLERERDEARALLAEMQQALKWATSYAKEAAK